MFKIGYWNSFLSV